MPVVKVGAYQVQMAERHEVAPLHPVEALEYQDQAFGVRVALPLVAVGQFLRVLFQAKFQQRQRLNSAAALLELLGQKSAV